MGRVGINLTCAGPCGRRRVTRFRSRGVSGSSCAPSQHIYFTWTEGAGVAGGRLGALVVSSSSDRWGGADRKHGAPGSSPCFVTVFRRDGPRGPASHEVLGCYGALLAGSGLRSRLGAGGGVQGAVPHGTAAPSRLPGGLTRAACPLSRPRAQTGWATGDGAVCQIGTRKASPGSTGEWPPDRFYCESLKNPNLTGRVTSCVFLLWVGRLQTA